MRDEAIRYARIWWRLCAMSFAAQLSTRMASLGFLAGKLVRLAFFLAFLVAIFEHVPRLNGYSLPEVILFFMTFNLVDVVAQFLFRGVYEIKGLIREGVFDKILAQPIAPLFRVSLETVDLLDLATLVPVVGVTTWTLTALPGSLTPSRVLLYLALVGNGIAIAYAVHVVVAALAVSTQELDNTIWVYRDLMTLGRFPVSIYAEPVRAILTYVVPVAIMTSFPARAALGALAPRSVALAVATALAALALAHLAWRAALRRYTSVSS